MKFEAVAETDGYVSIGLSDDKFMVGTQNKTKLNHIYRLNYSVTGMSSIETLNLFLKLICSVSLELIISFLSIVKIKL